MISVCLASYNGAPYIAEQLRSILSQLGPDDEVIVSDDGSTDHTLDVINALKLQSPTPIHYHRNTGEHGYASNFENALRQAKGDYIFLSDQDDVWLPSKVQVMLRALRQEGYGLVVSNARITDGDLHVTDPDYFAARGVHQGLIGNFLKFGYLGSCMAFTRRVLDIALPLPSDRRYCTHDNWIFLCAQAMDRVKILQEPLLLYRRHEGTSSTGALNAHKPLSFRISYRLYLATQLLRRFVKNKL